MKRKALADTSTTVLSVLGVLASEITLLINIGMRLNLGELALSAGSIIVVFIIGAYSVDLVKFANKLRASHRVFLSYSHADQSMAQLVTKALRERGVRVWLDIERLKPGDSIVDTLKEGIENSGTFVALFSERPTTSMLLEIRMAQAKGLRIIPVVLGDAELPSELRGLRYIDLRKNRARGIEELTKAAS